MTTSPNLAVRVRETRSRLRLAQTQFAHLLGVSIQTVNRWENGKTQPLPGQLFYNTQTEIEELEEESTGQTELSKTRLGALEILILSLAIQSFWINKF